MKIISGSNKLEFVQTYLHGKVFKNTKNIFFGQVY